MQLHSDYRKRLLEIVASLRIVPATKKDIEMLVRAFPELESADKFWNAYKALQKKPYQFLTMMAIFQNNKNEKDAIKLTSKGVTYLKDNGYDFPEYLWNKNLRDQPRMIRQYCMNETMIFIRGSHADFEFYSKDDFTAVALLNKDKYDYYDDMKQYCSSRVCGIFECTETVYPVYNLRSVNSEISWLTEYRYIVFLLQMLGRNLQAKYNKILLAESFEILDKTVLQEPFTKGSLDTIKRNNIRLHRTFLLSDNYGEIDRREKMYLLISQPEQQELLELLTWKNTEEYIREVVCFTRFHSLNYDVFSEDDSIGVTFGRLSAYETNEEVGFYLVQQELNYIYAVYRRMLDIEQGDRRETRRLKFYGLSQNKEIFDRVFARFKNVEFVELGSAVLFHYLRGRAEEEQ